MNYSDIKHLVPDHAGTVRGDHNRCLPTKNTLVITVDKAGKGYAYCHRCSKGCRFNLGVQLREAAHVHTELGVLMPSHSPDEWPIEAHRWYMRAGVSVDTMLECGWRYVPHWSLQRSRSGGAFKLAPRLCMQLYNQAREPVGVSARRIHEYDTHAKSLRLVTDTPFLVSDFNDNKLVLVEDELSWTKLYGMGISSACLQGTQLNSAIKQYIIRKTPRVFLFLDNDSAVVCNKTRNMFKEISLFTTAKIVYASRDCKNHNEEEIRGLIK